MAPALSEPLASTESDSLVPFPVDLRRRQSSQTRAPPTANAANVPMTIPAIAPPLRSLLDGGGGCDGPTGVTVIVAAGKLVSAMLVARSNAALEDNTEAASVQL